METKNLLPLKKFRRYDDYKCLFEIYAGDEGDLSTLQRFCKTILYVADWVKGRLDKAEENNGGDELKPSAAGYLSMYPAPEAFRDFDISALSDVDPSDVTGVGIMFDLRGSDEKHQEIWTLRIDEPVC